MAPRGAREGGREAWSPAKEAEAVMCLGRQDGRCEGQNGKIRERRGHRLRPFRCLEEGLW